MGEIDNCGLWIWVDNEMSKNEHSRSLRNRNKHHCWSWPSMSSTWKLKHHSLLSLDNKWGLLTCTETCVVSYEVISDAWLCLERKHPSSLRERMTNDTHVWAEGGGGWTGDDDGVYLSLWSRYFCSLCCYVPHCNYLLPTQMLKALQNLIL